MREVIIGVFHHSAAARRALEDLCDVGFSNAYVGLLTHDRNRDRNRAASARFDEAGSSTRASADGEPLGSQGEPLFTRLTPAGIPGLLGDAGSRARGWGQRRSAPARGLADMDMDDDEYGLPWAVDVVEGELPGVGAVVVGGLLAGVLDAGEDGVAGELAELGVTEAEAAYYQKLFARGRTIVVVEACSHARLVLSILGRHRAFERTLFRVPGEDPAPYASEGSRLA